MSTGIEWTDETWNPVTGCTKVSPGCDHCYAERITNRFGGPGAFDTVVLHPERLDRPLHWRTPRRVFVNSMSDLFHDAVPDEFIAQVFEVMAMAGDEHGHTFQVLTKRPGRMASWMRRHLGEDQNWARNAPSNVWLGTSIETQKWVDVRLPKLLETPAAMRFLSCEPLLGPLDLSGWLDKPWCPTHDFPGGFCIEDCGDRRRLDWVIVGGESGPKARPMHPDWARSLRDQCVAAGVPFFFKQWGEWLPDIPSSDFRYGTGGDRENHWDDGEWTSFRVGKKRAGRELDGRTWDEMPESTS